MSDDESDEIDRKIEEANLAAFDEQMARLRARALVEALAAIERAKG